MATDLVRDNATQLAGYLPLLEAEITESTSPSGSVGMAPRPADAPLPGNAQAFGALMVIWEAVPRLEAELRLEIAGHPGRRRGGSAGNFLKALEAIVSLSGGLDEDWEAFAARALDQLANFVRALPAVDEAQQWRHLRGRACPYCKCVVTLKVLLDARGRPTDHVECRSGRTAGCFDANGQRPVATIGTDARGVPELRWNDGLIETVPGLDSYG